MILYGMRVSRSGEAKLLLTAIHCLLYFTCFNKRETVIEEERVIRVVTVEVLFAYVYRPV